MSKASAVTKAAKEAAAAAKAAKAAEESAKAGAGISKLADEGKKLASDNVWRKFASKVAGKPSYVVDDVSEDTVKKAVKKLSDNTAERVAKGGKKAENLFDIGKSPTKIKLDDGKEYWAVINKGKEGEVAHLWKPGGTDGRIDLTQYAKKNEKGVWTYGHKHSLTEKVLVDAPESAFYKIKHNKGKSAAIAGGVGAAGVGAYALSRGGEKKSE